jgi:polysaccharide export outer membrane protein
VSGRAPANAAPTTPDASIAGDYLIGPGDSLQIFVWREPDLTTKVPVRPDGKISIPLVEDIDCTGKTATQLARDIESRLKKFVNDPVVTVIIDTIGGASAQQVRVVGEAATPKSLPYRAHMTALDAMIEVGGLTAYAAGNRASIVRTVNGKETSLRVHLSDLLKDGDMTANVELQPGDIIIIPQTFF